MISAPRPLVAAAAATLLFGAALPSAAGALAHPAASGSFGAAIYAGMHSGGLYRSSDGGATWQEADSGLPSSADITAIAVAANSSNVIYAGTNGSGVYVSTDNGRSWQDDNGDSGDLQSADVTGLVVDPQNSSAVYAAAGGMVYRSGDGGNAWYSTTVTFDSNLTALALDPWRPSTLIAGSDNGGIWYSTDGGYNWNQHDSNLPDQTQVNALVFSPRNADVAYAATANGIYQTIDGGQTWQLDDRGIPDGTTFQSIAVDPRSGSQVIAGATDGSIYRSTDGGTSWSMLESVDDSVNVLLFDPAHSGAVLAGVDNSDPLYLSYDNGADWQHAYPYLGDNGSILCLAAGARAALPTDPVPAPYGNPPGVQYVSASHHTIRGAFLTFYKRYGGLNIFGLPLTEAFSENGQTVQYFERARLVQSGTSVRLTPLGSQITAGRYFPSVGPFPSTTTRLYFPNTRHALSGQFLAFWRSHNGGYLFGAPICEPLYEQNGDGTGRTYLVQYFQNIRLEYHPELAGTRYVISLGQLGRQVLKGRGWL